MRRKWIPGRKIKAIEGPEDCGCGVCVGDGGGGSMGAVGCMVPTEEGR